MTLPTFPPTNEQVDAITLVRGPGDVAIEALAGTGKTTTLRFIAEDQPSTRIAYLAFNKAIVEEAKRSFPSNVKPSTAHGAAFRVVGKRYAHRLRDRRMTSREIAAHLGLERIIIDAGEGRRIPVTTNTQAGLIMRAARQFCQTADTELTVDLFERLPALDINQERRHNDELHIQLLESLRAAWADLTSYDGALRFDHNVYLKVWQLEAPQIFADLILFDEAQDANPLMAAIVDAQHHADRVYVGDTFQEIYAWNGAVNTMRDVPVDERTWLTGSFRFGPEIAERANMVLAGLGANARIRGLGAPGKVGPIDNPDVVLTRTNAKAVELALRHLAAGGRPHIVGGANEIVWFAKASLELERDGMTSHPELACFVSWAQVLAYVDEDALGGDLRLMVELVDEFGANEIIDGLERTAEYEHGATLVVSTAHKSKGREWPLVQLGDDFPEDPTPEEQRLLYVAITRGRAGVDDTKLPRMAS